MKAFRLRRAGRSCDPDRRLCLRPAHDRRTPRSRLADRSARPRRRLSLRPSEATRAAARTQLLAVPAGRAIVIDGLALGVLPEAASQLAGRNPLLALVHHPLALEWGLSPAQADALRASERAALAAVQRRHRHQRGHGTAGRVRLRRAGRAHHRRETGQRSGAVGTRQPGRRRAAAVGRRNRAAQGF